MSLTETAVSITEGDPLTPREFESVLDSHVLSVNLADSIKSGGFKREIERVGHIGNNPDDEQFIIEISSALGPYERAIALVDSVETIRLNLEIIIGKTKPPVLTISEVEETEKKERVRAVRFYSLNRALVDSRIPR